MGVSQESGDAGLRSSRFRVGCGRRRDFGAVVPRHIHGAGGGVNLVLVAGVIGGRRTSLGHLGTSVARTDHGASPFVARGA